MANEPTKELTDSAGRRKVRGNMDKELAVDVVEIAPVLEHIVLFSGDGAFRRVVEVAQRRGTRVSVVSTDRTTPPNVADELRRQTYSFIYLANFAPSIKRLSIDDPESATATNISPAPTVLEGT